jgi:hypothetical protein
VSSSRFLIFPPGRLQELLNAAEMPLSEFAARMEVSQFTAKQWVTGKSKPLRKTKLPDFLQVFGMESESQLYDGEKAKKFTQEGLKSIGSGNEDLGSLLVRLDGLSKSRMVFWNTLRGVYTNYILKIGDKRWPALHELVDITPPPPGLPLPTDEHIVDYPTQHGRSLRDSAAHLFRFCCAVYPAFAPGRALSDFSIVPPEKFDPFHFARMDHAKVWNRIGKLVHDGVIEFSLVLERVPTAGPLINLISYLELALIQWCRDRGPGKVYLFALNKTWKESIKSR